MEKAATIMDYSIFLTLFVTFSVCFREGNSQKFDFNESISFDSVNVWNGQSGVWSVQGRVHLTKSAEIMFEPFVSIQTCKPVCVVDLQNCPTKDIPGSKDECFCKGKVGDDHLIHVGSRAQSSQSEALLTATLKARDLFKPITATTEIGTLPTLSEKSKRQAATYRVDEGPVIHLLPQQNVTVCPDTFVTIQVCVPGKRPEAFVKIKEPDGKTSLSQDTCRDIVKKYRFDTNHLYELEIFYIESLSVADAGKSSIFVTEGRNCKTSTTDKPSQVNTCFSPDITKAVTSLDDIIGSLKLELNKEGEVNKGILSKLSSLESRQKQLFTLMQGIGSSLEKSLSDQSHKTDLGFSSIHQKIDKIIKPVNMMYQLSTQRNEVHMCSKDNGCETKQDTGRRRFQCYKLDNSSKVTWHEAVKKCQALGGFLAEIHDRESLEYVKRLIIRSVPVTDAVWIGASDEDREGIMTWITSGKPISVSDWAGGQPDNNGNIENCLEIRRPFNTLWNDHGCSVQQGFLCQKNDDSCDGWK